MVAPLPKVPETLLKKRKKAQAIREAKTKAKKAAAKVRRINYLILKWLFSCIC